MCTGGTAGLVVVVVGGTVVVVVGGTVVGGVVVGGVVVGGVVVGGVVVGGAVVVVGVTGTGGVLAVLFFWLWSTLWLSAVAVLTIGPVTSLATCTLTLSGGALSPTPKFWGLLQLTGPGTVWAALFSRTVEQLQPVPLAETNVSPAGRWSVMVSGPSATEGPAFDTRNV